jgi:hypothetical protein
MVLMCADCQAARGRGSGPYPVMTRAEMRAGPGPAADLGAGAEGGRQPPAHRGHAPTTGCRRAGGSHDQEPGLAWLERQAKAAEELVAQWKRTTENRPGS